jgi:hypothetical protein
MWQSPGGKGPLPAAVPVESIYGDSARMCGAGLGQERAVPSGAVISLIAAASPGLTSWPLPCGAVATLVARATTRRGRSAAR